MKKIENKIKNSIELPNLSFFEKLPKIQKQKKHHYVLAFASFLILFTIVIVNMNVNKSLSEQVLEDNIIFNILDMDNSNSVSDNTLNVYESNNKDTTSVKELLVHGYNTIPTTLEEANKYYNINMSSNNLVSSVYTTYDNDTNTILDVQLEYKKNDKSIIVRIAEDFRTWNIKTGGLLTILNNSTKSIINNEQMILAKYENNNYPVYYKFCSVKQIDYYHALYKKDNLYYYITGNDMTDEEFIQFLKEYIL